MSERLKILYIDDYELDRELVKDSLEREHGGFEVTEAASKKEFMAVLHEQKFDAILSDFNIAGFEGLEVIEIVRENNLNVPVIIVTGTGSEEIAVKAMLQGASDYVIKRPHHISRLPLTIYAAIEKNQLKENHEKANKALRESENRLKNLIQHIPAALLVYDAEFGIVESNAEAQRLLGMNADQLLGAKISHPVWRLLDGAGELLPIEEYPIHRALTLRVPIMNCVVGLPGAESGDITWLMVNAVPEYGERDSVKNVIVSFVDISKEKKTQEALSISEKRLNFAQEASNDGLWDWNLGTGEVYFNPRYYTMLGYQPYEMVPSYETWANLLHPDERELVEGQILSHLNKRDEPFELEFRMREKSGRWRWVLGKGKVFERDKDRKPLRATGTHTDIDHLKNIQTELFQSREKYWSLLNNVELGISMLNTRMETIEANRRMHKWFPQIAGTDKLMCFQFTYDPPRDTPCPDCPALKTFQDGLIHEEIHETTLAGKKTFLRTITSPVHNKQGDVVSVIRILEDVTEKKRAETRSLHLQKMEALGTLAGGISHDFNNILTAIIGFAELAGDEVPRESTVADDLKEIITAGRRAKDLVAQILAFSRKTEQEYKPVEIKPIIQESLRLMKSVLPSSIEIRSDLNVDESTVLSDPTQLHQILINLCTNSAHAMEEKGGLLEISLRNVSFDASVKTRYPDLEPGKYVCLSVCDSGQGIPPEIMERIFEPYFTTKAEGKGSGLGLAVVLGLVKMHGGHITVYSEIGKGSSFHVYLPFAGAITTESKKRKELSLPTGTERILLVDDELAILKLQQQSLTKLGYIVTTSSDSQEALQIFRQNPHSFDLILTDMTMPKMLGDELISEIKKIRPEIPVILCTGFSAKISMSNDNDLPIDAFLMKPVVREKMATTVRRILDKSLR